MAPRKDSESRKSPRDILRSRINALESLRIGPKPVDAEVRGNLKRWAAHGGRSLDHIPIRRGFVRRGQKLAEGADYESDSLIDKPKPKLPHPPPLAVLAPITKGVGLRVELSSRFLATTGGALGKDAKLKITLDGAGGEVGLVDLIAIPAVHRPSPGSPSLSSLRENRKRQIRDALQQLNRVGLVDIPEGGRKGEPRFDDVYLCLENGATAAGPRRYTRPKQHEKVVTIPAAFFVNGWIHALSKAEIAMWLMLRDLDQNSDLTPGKLQISGTNRLLHYDLSRAVWDTHANLDAYGLINVHKDPNRRANGTTIDGGRAFPHNFELNDAGLEKVGLDIVIPVLKENQAFREKLRA